MSRSTLQILVFPLLCWVVVAGMAGCFTPDAALTETIQPREREFATYLVEWGGGNDTVHVDLEWRGATVLQTARIVKPGGVDVIGNWTYNASSGALEAFIGANFAAFAWGVDQVLPTNTWALVSNGALGWDRLLRFGFLWPLLADGLVTSWGPASVAYGAHDDGWEMEARAACDQECPLVGGETAHLGAAAQGDWSALLPDTMRVWVVDSGFEATMTRTDWSSAGTAVRLPTIREPAPVIEGDPPHACGLLPCEAEDWPHQWSLQAGFEAIGQSPAWQNWVAQAGSVIPGSIQISHGPTEALGQEVRQMWRQSHEYTDGNPGPFQRFTASATGAAVQGPPSPWLSTQLASEDSLREWDETYDGFHAPARLLPTDTVVLGVANSVGMDIADLRATTLEFREPSIAPHPMGAARWHLDFQLTPDNWAIIAASAHNGKILDVRGPMTGSVLASLGYR